MADNNGRGEHYFLSRTCYEKIITGGLDFAFHCHHGNTTAQIQTKTQTPRHVVVVGAGLAGLSAAYELSQAGHEVTILERQERVGGRVKTIRHPLTDGLHAEVGPIRIPDGHYLDFHYLNLFGINTKPFIQKNGKAYYWVYGERVQVADWNERPGYYCDKFWNGWDANLSTEVKERLGIVDINSYIWKTIQPIIEELREADVSDTVDLWCRKWSNMTMTAFLRGEDSGSDKLRPWPEIALTGLEVVNYSIDNEASLDQIVKIVYYDIQNPNLSCVTDGMGRLPEAFVKKNTNGWNKDVELSQRIRYGVKVKQVELTEGRVQVIGEDVTTKHEEVITGDAVIITVPLTVLRSMDIPFPLDKMRAIGGVGYAQSTKILLQCRTQFWLKHYGINGGFSVTNLPIGQLQYPMWDGNPRSFDQRGVLTVFNFHGDSLFFAGLSDEEAIDTAVNQVAKIHPEILDEFEIGFVQTWGKDPTSQGATALFKPGQFNFATATLTRPDHPIYLAGEALSLNNGWMEGALESGLRAAYQFYSHNEVN